MAKFLFPIQKSYSGEKVWGHPTGEVCGPFETAEEAAAFAAKKWINSDIIKYYLLDTEIMDVKHNPLEKPENEKRKAGNFSHYEKVAKDRWVCKDCGETLLAVTVSHPIWDGPIPGSGFGECAYTDAPYCPNCEIKPSTSGAPIQR